MVGDAACAFIFHEPATVPQFEFAGTFRQEDEPLSEPHHFQPVNRDIAAFSFLLGYFGHGQAFRLQAHELQRYQGFAWGIPLFHMYVSHETSKENHMMKRNCGIKREKLCPCGNAPMPKQTYCQACHAAYMRDWRPDHPMSEDQRQRDIARSKVSVYLRRGKLHKTPCPCCGSPDVKARILDYAHPLKSVVWLCAAAHAYAVRTGNLPAIRKAA